MGIGATLIRARDWLAPEAESTRSDATLSVDAYIQQTQQFGYAGNLYPFGLMQQATPGITVEEIAESFSGYVQAAYRLNGVVAACMLARESFFSEARFQWRRFRNGRPGALFGDGNLSLLEVPWPNGTTGDLLGRMEQDSTLAGNFFGRRMGDILHRLRPDWTALVLASDLMPDDPAWAIDARVLGYVYWPGGHNSGAEPVTMLREEVVHYAPRKDPLHRFLGISLLTSAIREIQADTVATQQKTRFLEGGGPPGMWMLPIADPVKFKAAADEFRNRYGLDDKKQLVLQPGVEYQTIGSTLEQMDFKEVLGSGETRIAAALGVPPVIVGLSEGLKSATYSNYGSAMRRFADLTMRPLWRNAAASLQTVLDNPGGGAQLWYDDRDIPALKDDIVNRADVQAKQAAAAKLYFDAGWLPDSIMAALDADDVTLLEHSGLTSVQNQPGSLAPAPVEPTNGRPPPAIAQRSLADEAAMILEGGSHE